MHYECHATKATKAPESLRGLRCRWADRYEKATGRPDGYGRLRAMTMRWTWFVPS